MDRARALDFLHRTLEALMLRLALAFALLSLAACSGKDLPGVSRSDPTWALVPDHLNAPELPR
jgi:hypothetical protein